MILVPAIIKTAITKNGVTAPKTVNILSNFNCNTTKSNTTIINEPIQSGILNPCYSAEPPPATITTVRPNKKKIIK